MRSRTTGAIKLAMVGTNTMFTLQVESINSKHFASTLAIYTRCHEPTQVSPVGRHVKFHVYYNSHCTCKYVICSHMITNRFDNSPNSVYTAI